jgi:hypothetical protein
MKTFTKGRTLGSWIRIPLEAWALAFSVCFFFLIRLVGGGVQLGPIGTAATDWPIVTSQGDYEY